ncbi:hypothetical protein ABT352_33225 [Streptosporangium sp. NPDC000563]|uniref:hypothetical protein n=1 Tax=Streptosporangium sp. NPDC000563 TaxID=3154366 RepID=UPI003319B63D
MTTGTETVAYTDEQRDAALAALAELLGGPPDPDLLAQARAFAADPDTANAHLHAEAEHSE